ncbi:MAG: hypothetical protein WBG86_10605 [Polyangiales bacterium]
MILRTILLASALSTALLVGACGDSGDAAAACDTGICGENATVRDACLTAVDRCEDAGGSSSQCADAARQACGSAE